MAPPHPRGPCAPSVAGVQVRPLVCGTRQRPAEQARGTGKLVGGPPKPTCFLPARPRASGPPARDPHPRQPSPGHQNFPPHPALGPRSPASLLLAPGYRPCPSGPEGLPGRPGLSRDPRGPRGQGRAPMQVLLIEPIRDWMRGKTALGVGRPRPGAGGAAVLSACERACVDQGQPTRSETLRGWGQCSWWAGPRGPGWHPVASGDAV